LKVTKSPGSNLFWSHHQLAPGDVDQHEQVSHCTRIRTTEAVSTFFQGTVLPELRRGASLGFNYSHTFHCTMLLQQARGRGSIVINLMHAYWDFEARGDRRPMWCHVMSWYQVT